MAVNSTGQTFRDGSRLRVGDNGAFGSVRIDGGEQVVVTTPLTIDQDGFFTSRTLSVGRLPGGNGDLVVSGVGSSLDLRGGEANGQFGRDGGTGALTVEAGANFSAMCLNIGRNSTGTALPSTGTVTVTGAGSRLALSSDFAVNTTVDPFDAGYINLGRGIGGDGTLLVLDGGILEITNTTGRTQNPSLNIGRDGGEATVRVSGADSRLDMIEAGAPVSAPDGVGPGIHIGIAGTGTLEIEDGATVTMSGNDPYIGVGTRFSSSPANLPGDGTLTIRSGGSLIMGATDTAVFPGGLFLGRRDDTRGTLEVTGAGSLLRMAAPDGAPALGAPNIRIGQRGDSTMTVSDGARVEIDGKAGRFPGLFVARGDDDAPSVTGSLVVTGRGSEIEIAGTATGETAVGGFLVVGGREAASGEMTIADGGAIRLTSTDSFIGIGNRDGATGRATVEGARTLLETAGRLNVGVANGVLGAEALLTVRDGGRIRAGSVVEVEDTGVLDLMGRLEGDLAVGGTLEIGVGRTAHAVVTGDLLMEDVSTLALDATGFGQIDADRLKVQGTADFSLDTIAVDITVSDLSRFAAGDTIVFAEVAGGVTAQTREVVLDAALFRLEAAEGQLRLVALEDRGPVFADSQTAGGGGGRFTLGGDSGRFEGGAGNEVVIALGTAGNRVAFDSGSNRVLLGAGSDTVLGGDGNDTVLAGRGGDNFIDLRRGGDNRLASGDGADTVLGGAGRDVIRPGRGNDHVDGGAGDDFIANIRGDRTLIGGDGDDVIFGGIGDMLIFAGGGNNRVVSGPGRDVIAFVEETHETRILDFRIRSDKLDFSDHGGVAGFEDLSLRQVGNTTVIDDGSGGRILLAGVMVADIASADFIF